MATTKTQRSQAVVSVYLILKKQNQVLLSLRNNTGYFDNFYGLVAGHVEEGEPATQALIREVKEEIGIDLASEHLVFKGVMHRKSERNNVDLFFECAKWDGEIQNMEPQKCGHLKFFELNALPSNIIPYVKRSFDLLGENQLYMEEGW